MPSERNDNGQTMAELLAEMDAIMLVRFGLTHACCSDFPIWNGWNDNLDAEEMIESLADYDSIINAMINLEESS